MSAHTAESGAASREAMIEDYAAFWWAQETGETDRWEDLDADERENVIENSYAETVIDWLTETRVPPTEGADHG